MWQDILLNYQCFNDRQINRKGIAMRIFTKCLICFLIITVQLADATDNWPRWRGPNTNGVAAPGDYPVNWDPQKVLWKIDIPGKGYSTPIVWNEKIYMTAGVDKKDTLLAYDLTGKKLWQKKLGTESPGRHKNASGSNSSAVTDGTAIFAFFKSGTLAALELDGTVRWKTNLFRRYGKDKRYWDFGTSPALTKKYVVMAQMHDGESYLVAFDKVTGKVAWKVSRNYKTPQEASQGYTTPIVFLHKGTEALLVWGGQHLTAHDTADGKVIFSCGDFNPENTALWPSIASPVITQAIAIVPFGRNDRGLPRLHGIKMEGSGDVTKTHRLWSRKDIGPFIPCPTVSKGRVYIIGDRGTIDCINPSTGKTIWNGTFPKPKRKANFYSSPLIANNHLYAIREDGIVFILKLSDKFEIVSQIDMKDKIIASPIAISGHLLIRTDHHLFCIGK